MKKIALLPFYIKLYDDKVPQYHESMECFVTQAAETLRQLGFEVVTANLCRVKEEFSAAMTKFKAENCQAVVTLHAAYSPSLESIDVLCESDLPIVVFDSTPDQEFEFNFGGKLMTNHGIHGVQDMCNMLLQRGKTFLLRAGHYKAADFQKRLASAIDTACMAYIFTHGKVGSAGGIFDGMGDFRIPENVNLPAELLEFADDPSLAASDAEIEEEMALDRKKFVLEAELPEAVHRSTIAASLKLRKWIEKNQLTAFTVNFLECGKDMGLDVVPFLECSKAMTRKVGYAGEGDVLTALLCGTLLQCFPESTFTEMFCPDWTGNRILLSHMGEMNLNLMDQKPYLAERKWIYGDADDMAVATGCLRSGEGVLVNLAPGPGGSFSLITAKVRLTAQNDQDLTSMRGWFVPPGNMSVGEFLEAYSNLGGTHHLVLCYNADLAMLKDLAKLLNWKYCPIGSN